MYIERKNVLLGLDAQELRLIPQQEGAEQPAAPPPHHGAPSAHRFASTSPNRLAMTVESA